MRNGRRLSRALTAVALVLFAVAAKVGWHSTTSDDVGSYAGQGDLHKAAQLVLLGLLLLIVGFVVRLRARPSRRTG